MEYDPSRPRIEDLRWNPAEIKAWGARRDMIRFAHLYQRDGMDRTNRGALATAEAVSRNYSKLAINLFQGTD